jgi:L-malate glycosyltransferase
VAEVLEEKPRLGFVGPMLGTNPGWPPSQGETLARLFGREGYDVRLTSHFPNRALRAGDTVRSILRWSRDIDLFILMVFSGRAFVLADLSSYVANSTRTPLVLFLRGGNLPQFSQRHPKWVHRVLHRGDAVIAPSDYLKDAFVELELDVGVIPNVIALESYQYKRRDQLRPNILWMRTFGDVYQPQLALEVLALLRSRRPDVTMTMAGQDRGLFNDMQQLAIRRHLQDHVRFAGFLDASGKEQVFESHDIFLNTNLVDNVPVTLLEAAACGLPIVSTRVGGIPYLLRDEQTALLAGERDAVRLADCVERLLVDAKLAAALSQAGRRLAESCGWNSVKPSWDLLFQELMADA